MIIAVLSDVHDNIWNLSDALRQANEAGAEVLVYCGDFCAPFTLAQIARAFPGPVHAVFGNNDGERAGLAKIIDIAPGPREFELGGRRIVVAHDLPDIPPGQAAAADVILTGHTHAPGVAAGRPLRVNPGETGGWLNGRATCAVLDTETLEASLCELGRP